MPQRKIKKLRAVEKVGVGSGELEMENLYPLRYVDGIKGYKTVLADIGTIDSKNMRLRHSEEKLEKFFKSLKF
jgi:hypothetical protein